jgi:hypothetical protein
MILIDLELHGAETIGFSQRVCCDQANGSAASFLLSKIVKFIKDIMLKTIDLVLKVIFTGSLFNYLFIFLFFRIIV